MEQSFQRRPFKASDFLSLAQERRRTHFLSRSAAARAAALEQLRAAAGVAESPDPGKPSGSTPSSAGTASRTTGHRRRRDNAPRSTLAPPPLTVPEWAVSAPEHLSRDWLVMARPAGGIALLVARNGRVLLRGRNGHLVSHVKTVCVPGGGGCAHERGRSVLVVTVGEHMHALDVIMWNGRAMSDACAELRLMWLREALATCACAPRMPDVYNACAEGLRAAAVRDDRRDGVLLFHRKAPYAPGVTSAVLAWKDNVCSPYAIETIRDGTSLFATLHLCGVRVGEHGREMVLATEDEPPVRVLCAADGACDALEESGLSVVGDGMKVDGDEEMSSGKGQGRDGWQRLVRARVLNTVDVCDGAVMQLVFEGVAGKWRRHADTWSRIVFQCRIRHRPFTLDELTGGLDQ